MDTTYRSLEKRVRTLESSCGCKRGLICPGKSGPGVPQEAGWGLLCDRVPPEGGN